MKILFFLIFGTVVSSCCNSTSQNVDNVDSTATDSVVVDTVA